MPARVERAGAHVALLAAAVQQRRARDVAAEQQRADADRAAELVPGDGQRGDAAGGEVDRHLADRLDGVGVERHAVRGGQRGQLGDRLHRADLVVGPHRGDQRRRRRRAQRLGAGRPGRPGRPSSTGSQVTSAPSCRPSHSTASSTAWCSTALATTRRAPGVGRPPGPEDALDREVVALGAAAGEDHLGRPGAERRGDPLARLLDRAAGAAARRRAATTRCRPRARRRRRPPAPRRASAWSRRDRGMPSIGKPNAGWPEPIRRRPVTPAPR